jgi:hypothetical protein
MHKVVKLLRQKLDPLANEDFGVTKTLAEKDDGSTKKPLKSLKSKVKVYPSIQKALEKGTYGHMFSTERSGRVYVVSKGRGKEQSKDVPTAGGRIAKGFTPGSATPSADWDSIKKHAVRVGMKHGKKTSKRFKEKYGAGSSKEEEGEK